MDGTGSRLWLALSEAGRMPRGQQVMPYGERSGTVSDSTRPYSYRLTPSSSDRERGAGRHRESPYPAGVLAGSAAGPAVAMATALAPSGNEPGKDRVGAVVPQLGPGVERLGEYQGSGFTQPTYLARCPGGHVVQLSRLLYLVLSEINGVRTAMEIAARVSVAFGRTVSAGNVEYLLAKKFAPLGLLAGSGPAGAGQAEDVLTLKTRRTLVPAPAVQIIAWLLQPLFYPVAVVAVLGCLISSDVWLFSGARVSSAMVHVVVQPLLMLLVIGLALLSMLFHECGHAAACRYGGARPGVIGVGFYVVYPAFYTNVTDSYRLGRAGRVRTDLGGVYFNAVFSLALTVTYLATGFQPLLAAVVLVHLEILQQLLPTLRLDGYFIVADLAGVPDLFGRIMPVLRSMIPGCRLDPRVRNLKRSARVTVTAWVLLAVPFLALYLVLILLQAPNLARTFVRSLHAQLQHIVIYFGHADVAAGLLSVISVLFLVLPMVGLCYVLLTIVRQAVRLAVTARRRRPVLGYAFAATAVVLAAALAVHWGILPGGGGGATSPRPAGVALPNRHLPPPARPRVSSAPAPVLVHPPVLAHHWRQHAHVRPLRTMTRPHQPRRPRSAATPVRPPSSAPAPPSPPPTTAATPTSPAASPSASSPPPSPQPTTSGTSTPPGG
jgi:putative peptide zinc metalloprotease protein